MAAASAECERINAVQKNAFALVLAVGSRAIYLRDKLLGRIPRHTLPPEGLTLNRFRIVSGSNELDAVFAAPANERAQAAVLICHGIGEVVGQWLPVQQLLAERGVASLVFDYSGYGHSTGWSTPAQLEQDAITAYTSLSGLVAGPVSLLGFSLGTGVVPAILDRVPARRIVLCASYTSFRAAARRLGMVAPLSGFVPPIWDAELPLRSNVRPVLLVHSTRDRLFPLSMAKELASWCGESGQLRIVNGLRHNEPFYKATAEYWHPIADFLAGGEH
ncbi:MAG TPA: alpha/beta fold hydrolase [Terracidiphilus sp.]|nr:alpha/beta fold hydrolase [Terracidiphilus sp.]